ncbi:MAG: amidohydrolase family protein [Acidimicrobiales bacterium]
MLHDGALNLPERVGELLIEDAIVLTVDDDFTVHDPGWVHISGDHIAALGPGEAPEQFRRQARRTIDASGSVVMPGMVNAHTHLFQTFFRGLADDKPLLEWLRECIWPAAVHLDRDLARVAALLGLVENLRSGATSVIDHQYVHIDEHIDDAVCEAANELGVRLLLARGWADRNYLPELSESAALILERTERLRERWHGHEADRIRVELAPLIAWGGTDEAMAATLAKSREWGSGMHIHCAETSVEVDMNLDERGCRHVEWLERLGALGPDLQLAHSVWLSDHELDLISRHDAVVVHCPVSNMYLASGVARILDMRERGIRVALASDGPGSNNRQDMFEVLKATVLLQKIHNLDAVALQPEDVLEMATRGGSHAFGKPNDIGALTPGRKADLVVVNLKTVFSSPVHRAPSSLVFCASPADLTHVIVDGRLLIDEGALTMLDEDALLEEARNAARKLFLRADIKTRLSR